MPCELLDRDQTLIVHDYGPGGYVGTADINLHHGLRPGALLSVVYNTSEYVELNVKDIQGNILLHVVNRIGKNDFGLNSYIDGKWGSEEKVLPLPVHKGVRTVTNLLYQDDGYRIFINGKEVAFYKHRLTNMPHLLQVTNCQLYKIVYLTPKEIIP